MKRKKEKAQSHQLYMLFPMGDMILMNAFVSDAKHFFFQSIHPNILIPAILIFRTCLFTARYFYTMKHDWTWYKIWPLIYKHWWIKKHTP